MYKSKLSNMIDCAISECIQCGSGSSSYEKYEVLADWTANGKDILIFVSENDVILFKFIEKDVANYV